MSKAQQAGIPLRTHVPWAGGTNGRSTVDDHRRPRQRHLPDVRVGQHRARKSQERAARSKSSLRNLSAPPHVQVVRSPAWSSPDDLSFAGETHTVLDTCDGGADCEAQGGCQVNVLPRRQARPRRRLRPPEVSSDHAIRQGNYAPLPRGSGLLFQAPIGSACNTAATGPGDDALQASSRADSEHGEQYSRLRLRANQETGLAVPGFSNCSGVEHD